MRRDATAGGSRALAGTNQAASGEVPEAAAIKASYVTIHDPLDIAAWSGLNRHIALALEAQGIELQYVGALKDPLSIAKKVRFRAGQALGLPRYMPDRSHLSSRYYARQISGRIDPSCNLVFATGTIPTAYLETDQPQAFWTDATLPMMLDFYPAYSNISRRSRRAGLDLERRGLEGTSLAIYSSAWAATGAIEYFDLDPEKVVVVPFGANLEDPPTAEEVDAIAAARSPERCQLLFLAVEWERKGGDIAVEAARWLNALGIPTTLVVVGCTPPAEHAREEFVDCRGFLDKKSAEGTAELRRLLAESHFLIHPARADATPIALAEASGFGLPVVASQVGGIPTIVRDGCNGYTLPSESEGEAYAALVKELFEDRQRMLSLARDTYGEYASRLNWDASGAAVARHLARLVR
jgi:glycosyltransferase involved in cell wall biosynthesis